MSEQHQRFLSRLASSSDAVFRVAKWLHAEGTNIEISPIRFAPTAAQADQYVDAGDIIIVNRERVEVKHLGVNFTGRADWPFREVFVSNKAAVDRALGQVCAWISVSKDLTCAAVVTPASRDRWHLSNVRAKNTGNVEAFYAADLDDVIFCPLPEK